MNWKTMDLTPGQPPMGVRPGMVVKFNDVDGVEGRSIIGHWTPHGRADIGNGMFTKIMGKMMAKNVTAWAWLPGCEEE